MHIGDGVRSAFSSIASHKLRSILTTTGIVIGVMAVVTMFSSVYALKQMISENMEGMGWNHSLLVIPANFQSQDTQGRAAVQVQRRAAQNVQRLGYDDYIALRDSLSYKSIYGLFETSSLLRIGNKDNYVSVRATDNGYFQTKNYGLTSGRYFSNLELDEGLPVAILGSGFVQAYYPNQELINEIIILGNHRYRVIGILGTDVLNTGSGMNFNTWERDRDLRSVYVPLRYAAYRFGINKMVHMIYLQAEDQSSFSTLRTRTRQLLLARHNMYPNFSFMDIGAMMLTISDELDKNMKKWNITLSAIASIALIVGGVGLFSTLLISIQERMAEIGIRKSIGATDNDIFFYFITEALILAWIGAAVGIGIAWLMISIMGQLMHIRLFLPIPGVVLGILFSTIIGFLSGLYPALKAAKIDPIKAIYYKD
jgi:putative ABC transport system permease protein